MREALTRAAVVTAATELLQAEGLERLTVRRVAARLGVTAPALYAHVRDKEDLLRAVADAELALLLARFEAVPSEDPVAQVTGLAHAYVDHARERPELFRVLFLFPPGLSFAAPDRAELPRATEVFSLGAEAVQRAVATGRFAPTDPILASMTTWACMHGLVTILQMGFRFDPATEQQMVDHVIATMVGGLQVGQGAVAPTTTSLT